MDKIDREFYKINNSIKERLKAEYIIYFIIWLIVGIIILVIDIKFKDKYIASLFGLPSPSKITILIRDSIILCFIYAYYIKTHFIDIKTQIAKDIIEEENNNNK